MHRAGLRSASLWAAVPHYVSLAPNPSAALSLCERLGGLLGSPIDTAELEEARETFITQVSEAVSTDADTAAYVEELEQRAETLGDELDVPSGDSIAAELTRYLRERESGNGEHSGPTEQSVAGSPAIGSRRPPDIRVELRSGGMPTSGARSILRRRMWPLPSRT